MTHRHYTDWPPRLPAIARMRKAGETWKQIGEHFGVSKEAILGVSSRYAAELKSLAERPAQPAPKAHDPAGERVIEPEIVIEGGQTIKRYPPMWADGTGFGVTARPRVKPKRND